MKNSNTLTNSEVNYNAPTFIPLFISKYHEEFALFMAIILSFNINENFGVTLEEAIKSLEENFRSRMLINFIDKHGRLYIKDNSKEGMQNYYFEYMDRPSTFIEKKIKIGQLIYSMASSKKYKSIPPRSALSLAQTADTNNQYKLYFDSNLQPVGVITWAWVSQDCLDRVCHSNDLSLHPAEWNEGRILWFRDVAVNASSASEIARDLSGGLFPEISECFVTMHSRKSGRSIPVKFSSTDRTQLADWIRNKV